MQVDDAVLEILKDDVAAIHCHRRPHPGFEQFLDLVDDVGVGRVVLEGRSGVGSDFNSRGAALSEQRRVSMKWSSRTDRTSGSSWSHSTVGAAETETKSRPK